MAEQQTTTNVDNADPVPAEGQEMFRVGPLTEEIMMDGAIYGPGTFEVPDKGLADRLNKREAQLRRQGAFSNRKPMQPNGIMTGVLPGTETGRPSIGYRPEDAERVTAASQAAAEAAHAQEEALRQAGDGSDLPQSSAPATSHVAGTGVIPPPDSGNSSGPAPTSTNTPTPTPTATANTANAGNGGNGGRKK